MIIVIEGIEFKYCPYCDRRVQVTNFNKCNSRGDGLQGICKDCEKAKYLKNKEAVASRNRLYKLRNKEAIAEYNKTYYKEHK